MAPNLGMLPTFAYACALAAAGPLADGPPKRGHCFGVHSPRDTDKERRPTLEQNRARRKAERQAKKRNRR